MVFEASDVPLTEDILQDKPKFIPTFFEHIARVGEQVFVHSDRSLASEATIYTVPDNKTLWISAVVLSCGWLGDTGGEHAHLAIDVASAQKILLSIFPEEGLGAAGGDHSTASVSYPHMIKVESGQVLRHDNPTNGQSSIDVFGYLIDKKIIL